MLKLARAGTHSSGTQTSAVWSIRVFCFVWACGPSQGLCVEAHHFVLFFLKTLVSTITSPEIDTGQCVQADTPTRTQDDRTIAPYASIITEHMLSTNGKRSMNRELYNAFCRLHTCSRVGYS